MKAVAIVLASGSGERFDAKNTPKHLTPILGVPIMIWTLKTIIKSNIFSFIIVVTRDQDLLSTKKAIRKYLAKSPSYIKLTSGSNERMKSFFLGLEYLNNLNKAQAYEFWEWQERQSKYIVNSVRSYEFHGYSWRLPFWSMKFVQFWRETSLNSKYDQSLYKDYLRYIDDYGVYDDIKLGMDVIPQSNLKNKYVRNYF